MKPTDTDLRRALHQLADAPGPADLADRALTGARAARRRQLTAMTAVAAGAVVALPFLYSGVTAGGSDPVGAAVTPTPTGTLAAMCDDLPHRSTEKFVLEADWPQFVRVLLAALPPRDDYQVQSGYGICNRGHAGTPNAYAVIGLGPDREHGHLTVSMFAYAEPQRAPATCAALYAQVQDVLFCEDAAVPLVYGVRRSDVFIVGAVYPDRRAIALESVGTDFGGDALRDAVTDPDLVQLLPVLAGPPATLPPVTAQSVGPPTTP